MLARRPARFLCTPAPARVIHVQQPSRGKRIYPAIAIEELLRGSEWSLVCFHCALDEVKSLPELVMKRIRAIAHDIETAAPGGAFGSKGAKDDVPARPHRPGDVPYVSSALLWRCEEVKDCPVVPDVEGVRGKIDLCDIRLDPVHIAALLTQAILSDLQGSGGDIKHREAAVATNEQVIDERAGPGSDINNRGRWVFLGRLFDESERGLQVRTEPTYLLGILGGIDAFPMFLHTPIVAWIAHVLSNA